MLHDRARWRAGPRELAGLGREREKGKEAAARIAGSGWADLLAGLGWVGVGFSFLFPLFF